MGLPVGFILRLETFYRNMTYPRFYALLAFFTAVAVAAVTIAHLLLSIGYAVPLTVGSILMFVTICMGMFYVGKRTAGAENKFMFTNAFMGITMFKLFLCGSVIAAYAFLGAPENKLFVVPFFLSYLIYTVLEVIFLIKLAGNTSVKAAE